MFKPALLGALLAVIQLVKVSSIASAALFLVTDHGDSGAGTLRDAIQMASTTPGQDIIRFDLPSDAMGDPLEITLTSDELEITDSVRIFNQRSNF